MIACTSPCRTVRFSPLTMGLSPMLMWRSLISSWLMKIWEMGVRRWRWNEVAPSIDAVRVARSAAAVGQLDAPRIETRRQQLAQAPHHVLGELDIVHLAAA